MTVLPFSLLETPVPTVYPNNFAAQIVLHEALPPTPVDLHENSQLVAPDIQLISGF